MNTTTNRMSAEQRLLRDPQYAQLVEVLYQQILNGNYTPTELREAVIIAASKYEMYNCRRLVFADDKDILRLE